MLPLAFLFLVPAAQESDPPPAQEPVRGVTIVTATRQEEDPLDTPFATATITSDELRDEAIRTTPQALRSVPGVLVQETAFGQGSPFIRGFTGFRNVFQIDGIRLNNSVFRDGPNQYWNTVDSLSIEQLEVVKGPGSVLHGSDAIGGTVNAITRNPYGWGEGSNFSGTAYYRVSSAEDSHIGRLEGSFTDGRELGALVGVSGKTFGDLRGGDEIGRQSNTGYDEYDLDAKVERFIGPGTRLVLAYQKVRQNNVPRTHRTVHAESWEGTTVGSDLRRDLDQERELVYAQLHGDDLDGFIDDYTVSLSYHEQSEVRDRIRSTMARDKQGFEVGTLGLFAHLGSETSIGDLTWGFDYYRDEVDSFSTGNPIQGPVGDDATYDLVGAFVQDRIEVSEQLDVTLGARFNYARAEADSVSDPVTSTQISVDEDWDATVGSARFLYRVAEDAMHVFGGIAQGFRAPNLSDLTRFDSARTNEFEIPSLGLDPENTLTFEVGAKGRTSKQAYELSYYYTNIDDQIIRFPTGNVNMLGEFEITKDNVGDGYVWGVEYGHSWSFDEQWSVFGNATYMEGRVDTFPTSAQVKTEEWISRLMPFTAQLGLRWDDLARRRWVELVAVGADKANRLSTRDQGDTSRIPPGGTPGYVVLHLHGGWKVRDGLTVDLGLENLLNEDYRVHGSGTNMPGFNLLFGLRASF